MDEYNMSNNYNSFLEKAKQENWSESRSALEWWYYPKTKADSIIDYKRFLNSNETIAGITYSVKESKELAQWPDHLVTETIYVTKGGEYFKHESNFIMPREIITPISKSEAESLIKSIKTANSKSPLKIQT